MVLHPVLAYLTGFRKLLIHKDIKPPDDSKLLSIITIKALPAKVLLDILLLVYQKEFFLGIKPITINAPSLSNSLKTQELKLVATFQEYILKHF